MTTGAGSEEVVLPALDALPCGIVSFHDDGRVAVINASLLDLLGYSRGEIEGRHVEQLLTVAGKIFFQTHVYPLVRLGRQAQELFVLLRHRDGHQVGALVNASRREMPGGGGGGAMTDCVVMEVRERGKFEEALLRAKREAESVAEVLRARTRELETVNQRLQEQTTELALQQDQLEDQAAEMEAQAEQLVVVNEELMARSLELEHARAGADEANQAKSQFLAVMSHELRTPLNAIGGYVQLIELGIHGEVTEAQREALHRIAGAQRHLLRLINDILNLSRIEAGHVDYRVEVIPIPAVLETVMPMVEPQMAAAGLEARLDVEPGTTALADREKVQQVLINLLTNAVKFTPAGGRITVTARCRDAATVVIAVSDTGIGMPADKLASIFEPFVQVDSGLTRREGTGLGLAISRDLARGMGGDLSVESELSRGSTFHLSLPSA